MKTTINNKEEILNSDKKVVLKFWAEWCNPCQAMKPILEDFDKDFEWEVIDLDVEKDAEILTSLQKDNHIWTVMSIPALFIFENWVCLNKNKQWFVWIDWIEQAKSAWVL